MNLGKSIREYIKLFKEPLIDEKGAKIYEWENQEGVRFRTIADIINQRGGRQLPLSLFESQIITFYSDRNLNERMQFKNPLVARHYEAIAKTKEMSITSNEPKKEVKQQSFNKKPKSNGFGMGM
ncbi:hypothetical protein BKH41_04080 [Helicobacter sp. 12S02232-10]|uniref:hypothetical protein n=1 Tax=Helicobacter sp. 12S02232-10 TaxID=1476197 RepID=UPI000BDCFC9A|nr:hypothetical protein [Helicobacter sp. 12S02232-10]PAF48814.1 hypothetical protein BKH41_04080 [Helicobacter sp. 12S02232-10]